jgi:hypothetical protein
MMAIVGRVAALMHKFSKQAGKISVDTFKRAWMIVDWHMHEFKRIFSPQMQGGVPQVQGNAQTLEEYLHRAYRCRGHQVAPKNNVLHDGPIRPGQHFEAFRYEPILSTGFWQAAGVLGFVSARWESARVCNAAMVMQKAVRVLSGIAILLAQ